MERNCLVPFLGTFGQGWMRRVHCCDKLALICLLKRGGQHSVALTGQTRLDQGKRKWNAVTIPSETSPRAPNLVHHSYFIGLYTTPSAPASLIKQAFPGASISFFLLKWVAEGTCFCFHQHKAEKTPQSYIRMGCGWLEKNGFPAALYVLKPINWYSVSTISCFVWQVKPALAWWDISGRTFPVPAWHNSHSHSSDVPD